MQLSIGDAQNMGRFFGFEPPVHAPNLSSFHKGSSEQVCVYRTLRRAKSFLSPPELLTTYKAFVHRLMEYCAFLWAGAPASHISRLHAVESKAFWIIGISRDEAESLGLSLSRRRQVGGLSFFYHLLSGLDHCSVCDLYPPIPVAPGDWGGAEKGASEGSV